jgi:hypothetical protein
LRRSAASGRLLWALGAGTLATAGACQVDLAGAHCPCVSPAWVCCESEDVCRRATEGCGAAPAHGTGARENDGVLVATVRGDNARTGTNSHETSLNTANVSASTFGKLFERPLRGGVRAEPLYVPKLETADGRRDVVFVATMRNYVYALDASDPARKPYWMRQLGEPVVLPDAAVAAGYPEFQGEIGVLSTPVIDPAGGALYVVAATNEQGDHAHFVYELALDTGEELAPRARIEADGFASERQMQSSALLFERGVLYVAFGGYGRDSTAPGWLFAYDQELELLDHVATAAAGGGAGITMSGQGPAADDAGRVYFTTERAESEQAASSVWPGSSLLAVEQQAGRLAPAGRFVAPAPSDVGLDGELGASGPVVLPGSDGVLVGGARFLYLASRNALTPDASSDFSQIFQVQAGTLLACTSEGPACRPVYGAPAFAQLASGGRMFVWPAGDTLSAFDFDPGAASFGCGLAPWPLCAPASRAESSESSERGGDAPRRPGGTVSVSSDGQRPHSAIVWASHPYSSEYEDSVPDGVLRAYDAENLGVELWSSNQNPGRDDLGPRASEAAPVVTGGRVFVPTVAGLSNKVTLDDSRTPQGPGLTAVGDGRLVLAWPGIREPADGIHLAWSSDGLDFSAQTTLQEAALFTPALASDGTRLFMAFAAGGDLGVRVLAFDGADFSSYHELAEQQPSGETAPFDGVTTSAPALVYGHERLFLAFRFRNDNSQIHVISSGDGERFDVDTGVSITDAMSEPSAPGLALAGSKLYLYWVEQDWQHPTVDPHLIVLESDDDGRSFGNERILPQQPLNRPGLLAFDTGGQAPDLFLFWSDPNVEFGPMKVSIFEDADLGRSARAFDLTGDETADALAATQFRGRIYVAWMGSSTENFPNVARYSPGGLVTYGLLPN